MSRSRLLFLTAGLVAVGMAVWGFASYVDARPGPPSRLPVAVSVPPQAWLVKRIGGERVDVEVLLPPGVSEHSYEPTPQQAARLAESRLIVRVGDPALAFEPRLLDSLPGRPGRQRPQVVDMSRGAAVVAEPGSGPGAWVSDPHLWLSPAAMRRTAAETAAALAALDPGGAPSYQQQLHAVQAEIDAVAAVVRAELGSAPRRRLYVDHPAWTHLLLGFDIEQVAIEHGGREPSPRQLLALVEGARRDGVRALFVERGQSSRGARAVADEIGARIVTVDPMAEDWPANLRRTARLFREALGG